MSNANEPAKPCRATINRDSGELQPYQFGNNDFECLGLTKREWLAGMAMQGLLASGKFQVDGEMSREAWSAADQMLWQQERDAEIERYTGQVGGQQ